ncbi:MAG: hypothetical protein PHI63_06705, partial [Patescibacteria group bacterium]|nr:hypothetical protein [Patescibacteria group bacterium]
MANDLDPFIPEYWSRRMQVIHEKKTVYRAFANFEEQPTLKNGDTVHRPYRSALYAQSYTRDTAVTVQAVSGTDQYLSVNQAKIVPFYVDTLDSVQNKWDAVDRFAEDAQLKLNEQIDGYALSQSYQGATSKIDDADFS